MQQWRRARAGITLMELLVVVFIVTLLIALIVPLLNEARYPNRLPRCKRQMSMVFKGARLYLNDYDEYFPLAWHEGAGAGFGQVTFARSLIREAMDPNVDFRQARGDAAKAKMLEETVQFWSCPAQGLTNDYFSPPVIFRLPASHEMTEPYDQHTQYTELTAKIPSTQMPFLTDVAASTPRPDAADAPEEIRTGVPGAFKPGAFHLDGTSYDVFYGVAQSWSDWDSETKKGSGYERFDYRHGRESIHVIFLDGHIDRIEKTDTPRLEKLHERWNTALDADR